VRIKYCAASCGSGKTHQIINRAFELVRNHNRVLVLQPTRELIDRTVNEELQALVDPPPVRVFHGGTIGKAAKVSKALADYVKDPPDLPEIVLATHQVLPHIKQFANKGEWHVLIDESLQAVRYCPSSEILRQEAA
jgi:superfamily II DNA or RNA helicase